ncbi:MAG: hypothetical protein V2G41_09415 [bacterium JZ-2024 1]
MRGILSVLVALFLLPACAGASGVALVLAVLVSKIDILVAMVGIIPVVPSALKFLSALGINFWGIAILL